MKKNYIWHGKQYQFTEGKQPADAVPVETVKAEVKAQEPAKNKARETKKK